MARKARAKGRGKTSAAGSRAAKTDAAQTALKVSKQDDKVLTRLNLLSGALYVVLIGLTLAFMRGGSISVSIPYLTKDPLVNSASLAAASRPFYNVDLRVLVVSTLILSLAAPILYLTKYKNYYQSAVKKGVIASRWYENALVTALILVTIALISGWTDALTLKFVGFTAIILAVFGCFHEKALVNKEPNASKYEVVTNLSKLFVIVLFGLSALATVIYGIGFNGWYAYALYALITAYFIASDVNYNRVVKQGGWLTERNNALINLLTRGGFALILITGLMK
jgi:hypothetical protein